MVNQPVLSVPFYEDQVEAIRDPDGEVHVVIRRVCENLGVNYATQFRKLRNYHWATVVMMTTVAQDGRQRELAVLPLRQLGGWLFKIEPNRVAEHLREKIRRYQLEVVDVLYKHFLAPDSQAQAQAPGDPITAMLEAMLAIRQSQQFQGLQIFEHEGRLSRTEEVVGNLRTGIAIVKDNIDGLAEVAEANIEKLDELGTKIDQLAAQPPSAVQIEIVPSSAIPPLTLRALIHQKVNDYVARTQGNHELEWRRLHDQAYYRLHYDVRARKRHSNCKSLLEQAERDGMIVKYYDLAKVLFDIESFTPTVKLADPDGGQATG